MHLSPSFCLSHMEACIYDAHAAVLLSACAGEVGAVLVVVVVVLLVLVLVLVVVVVVGWKWEWAGPSAGPCWSCWLWLRAGVGLGWSVRWCLVGRFSVGPTSSPRSGQQALRILAKKSSPRSVTQR